MNVRSRDIAAIGGGNSSDGKESIAKCDQRRWDLEMFRLLHKATVSATTVRRLGGGYLRKPELLKSGSISTNVGPGFAASEVGDHFLSITDVR
jgi:hypothetical protein